MAIAPDIVDRIARRLAGHAGLEPPAWVVEARASSRIAELGCAPDLYAELIESARGTAELEELVEAVRVGESRLFRHHTQIAALVDAVVPAWRARGRRSIRVWSAGCAAGEEPYTLAAVLAAAMPGTSIAIVASDVSADALELARSATYPADAIDDVPEAWRDAFTFDDGVVRVRGDLAAMVRFERANLVDGPIGRAFDLVWCRNVLIYFTPEARKRVLDTLVGATAPGGFVFVGYSESLRDVAELDAMRAGDAVYYMKREQPRALRTPPLGVPAKQRPPTNPGFAAPPGVPDAPNAGDTTEVGWTPVRTPALPRPSGPRASASTTSGAAARSTRSTTTGLGWPAVSATARPNSDRSTSESATRANSDRSTSESATRANSDRSTSESATPRSNGDRPTPESARTSGERFTPASATARPNGDRPMSESARTNGPASVPPRISGERSAPASAATRPDGPASESATLSAADRPPNRRAFSRPPTDPGVLRLRGTPDIDDLTAELTTRLAAGTVDALTIDLDDAELLGDELAPVFRRASAAARSAGVELVVRATRTGPKRWLARHGIDGDDT